MDIITHTLSGVAVASVIINLKKFSFKQSAVILGFGALGGCLPDIDVISMWSGFDGTFGQWFNLNETGRNIYTAKYWYSHHAFFHSLLASILFTGLLATLSGLRQKITKGVALLQGFQIGGLASFFFAYNIHLVEDMLTPSSAWGGVAYFWPSPVYIGGWGKIWWWNNYDIFGIVLILLTFNLIWRSFVKKQLLARVSAVLSFAVGVTLISYQVNTREVDYNYSQPIEFKSLESQSLDEQKVILGDPLFNMMIKLDQKVPVHF